MDRAEKSLDGHAPFPPDTLYWLVQSSAVHPELACGLAPEGLLNAAEQEFLDGLRAEKRRREWLLGRWTAKQLLQSYCQQALGYRPPWDALIIGRNPSGGPVAALDPRNASCEPLPAAPVVSFPAAGAGQHGGRNDATITAPAGIILPVSLSISHSGDYAFCALANRAAGDLHIGADIERIRPLNDRFIARYFTAQEGSWVRQAPASRRDLLAMATWSAKEALLKALQVGLTVDPRRVVCLCRPEQDLSIGQRWAPVAMSCDASLLESRDSAAGTRELAGWWRPLAAPPVPESSGEYVMTLAVIRILNS